MQEKGEKTKEKEQKMTKEKGKIGNKVKIKNGEIEV
jgi:hypothetical protein